MEHTHIRVNTNWKRKKMKHQKKERKRQTMNNLEEMLKKEIYFNKKETYEKYRKRLSLVLHRKLEYHISHKAE